MTRVTGSKITVLGNEMAQVDIDEPIGLPEAARRLNVDYTGLLRRLEAGSLPGWKNARGRWQVQLDNPEFIRVLEKVRGHPAHARRRRRLQQESEGLRDGNAA